MWYITSDLMDAYQQRMQKQSQISRVCRLINKDKPSMSCKFLQAMGNLLVHIGLELNKMSRTPSTPNGVFIYYEHSKSH